MQLSESIAQELNQIQMIALKFDISIENTAKMGEARSIHAHAPAWTALLCHGLPWFHSGTMVKQS